MESYIEKSYIVVWLDDSNDLRVKDFDTKNAAESFGEEKGCKHVVIHGNISCVDTAYAC